MQVKILLVCFQVFLLAACDAADPVGNSLGEPLADPPAVAAIDSTVTTIALDDSIPDRTVSLFIKPESGNSYTPVFDNRIVVAEPVYTVPVAVARAQGLVDGVNVVYVGSSCQELQSKYSDLFDCVEEETAEFRYGEVEATVTTDSEGFASIALGGAEKYRLSVQSFATSEDPACYWGGEAIADITSVEVSISLLVFCE